MEFEKAARIYKTSEVTFGIEKCHQVQLFSSNRKEVIRPCTQAILSSIGEGQVFLSEKILCAVISDIAKNTLRKAGKASQMKLKSSENRHSPGRPVVLKFSNLLQEEEIFLNKMKKLEKFNFESDFKINGKKVSDVKVVAILNCCLIVSSLSSTQGKITRVADTGLDYVRQRKEFWKN